MSHTFQLEVVSAESAIFSGSVEKVVVTGSEGELGIYPGHTPLLATLKPGFIRISPEKQADNEEVFYVSGGILETQPDIVIILADTVLRADYLNEADILRKKAEAQGHLANKSSSFAHEKAMGEISTQLSAQIRAIQELHKKARRH